MQKVYSTYTKSPRLWTMVVPKKKKNKKISQILPKAVSNRRPIAEPKPKIDLQHNTYSLVEDLFWVTREA